VFSIQDKEKCPEIKGLLRARVEIGGWIIEPHLEQKGSSYCTYISETDLGGSLPGWAIKQANKDQGQ